MLVLINAMKSISRSIGRNVLIGIIVLSISVSSCVALAIRNAASEAETAGIDMVNITGTITVDRQKLMEAAIGNSGGQGGRPDMSGMRELMSKYQDLSLSELQTYAQSDYVKNFYYQSSISLNASGDLEPYSTQTSGNSNSGSANNSNRTDNRIPGGGMAARACLAAVWAVALLWVISP
jgi:putative ABC transport system permease protein